MYLLTTVSWFCISLSFFRPRSVIGDTVTLRSFSNFLFMLSAVLYASLLYASFLSNSVKAKPQFLPDDIGIVYFFVIKLLLPYMA